MCVVSTNTRRVGVIALIGLALSIPGSAQTPLVSNLVVNDSANAGSWSIQPNLQAGNLIYGDRAYALSQVPGQLAGAAWIRTANSSKSATQLPLVSFALSRAANVNVAWDTRVNPRPIWFDTTWQDTGQQLSADNAVNYEIFQKAFPAGTVSLGPLGAASTDSFVSMYAIVVLPVQTPLISSLVVNDSANAGGWSFQSNLQTGNTIYGDRGYAFSQVPGQLAGATWIRTANSSKAATQNPLVSFAVSQPANVAVGLDTRVNPRPTWFDSTWQDTGQQLSADNAVNYEIFEKTFPAGTVLLGPLGAGSTGSPVSMYVIVVLPGGGGGPQPLFNGNPVLPPKWAFGVLWGSYHNQSQVLSDVNTLRANGYGGDLYWIDSSWLSSSFWTPENYICFNFDAGQFSDPASMIGALRNNHLHFGVWEWPWVDQGCPAYSFGASHHYFVEDGSGNVLNGGGWHGNTFTGAFDYTNAGTVSWWNGLNQPLVNAGVNFFKMDADGVYPSGGALHDGNNSQDHYKALYRTTAWNLSATANGGRGFILTHTQPSTAADQAPGMWTGDSTASWDGLQHEMGIAASLNTSGTAAYWCGDTGGYEQTPSSELYIRWLEYTTFTPCQEFFGSKTTSTGSRFPWDFGTQAVQISQTYSLLRYRLLPFRYSNAQIAYHVQPVQYPVHWIGSNQVVNGTGDSEILVQPVTLPGATTASVSLPEGSNWIDFRAGTVYPGGTTQTIPAPIDQIPMLVKAGSIIPMGPAMTYVDELPADPLTLEIFPAGSTSYTLYEDDGVTAQYAAGAYSQTKFSSNNSGGSTVITIGAAVGTYSGRLAARTYVLRINLQSRAPLSVTRDGNAEAQVSSQAAFDAASEGWYYDATAKVVSVKFRIPTTSSTAVALR